MWKTILLVAVVAAGAYLGWDAWTQRRLVAEARAEAAVLVARQDSAKAEAARAQAAADSVAAVLDSLEAVRAQEKAVAARRAAVLRERADSLEGAIGGLMPPELVDREIAEAVMDAVREIRMADDERIADLTNLLAMTELSLERSQEQAERVNAVNANLRLAIGALEEERDLWRGVAQPNLLARLKRDAPGMAIAAGLVLIISH